MKPNHNNGVSIEKLKEFEKFVIPVLLLRHDEWRSMDVNYHPPRVERLFMDHGDGYRIYLHVIHRTDEKCLYHKHKWPAALKQVWGSYKMGITYSPDEISSDEAHALPDLACFEIGAGSYYEMTQTDAAHYVRPVTETSGSIMLTRDRFVEHVIRKEVLDKPLMELSMLRKVEILELFSRKLSSI